MEDIVTLICTLPDVAKRELHGPAVSLCQHAKKWQEEHAKWGRDAKQTKHWRAKVSESFTRFREELKKQIEQGNLANATIIDLVSVRDQLKDIGL